MFVKRVWYGIVKTLFAILSEFLYSISIHKERSVWQGGVDI